MARWRWEFPGKGMTERASASRRRRSSASSFFKVSATPARLLHCCTVSVHDGNPRGPFLFAEKIGQRDAIAVGQFAERRREPELDEREVAQLGAQHAFPLLRTQILQGGLQGNFRVRGQGVGVAAKFHRHAQQFRQSVAADVGCPARAGRTCAAKLTTRSAHHFSTSSGRWKSSRKASKKAVCQLRCAGRSASRVRILAGPFFNASSSCRNNCALAK